MPGPAGLADALLAADATGREALLREAEPIDLQGAISALGQRHVPEAAEALSLVESTVVDRTLRKAARRELHRLRSAGIDVPVAATARPAPTTAVRGEPRVRVSEAWATDIDPTGSRALWLLGDRPLGGAWFAALLVNDLKGLLELSLVDTTRKRFQRELEQQRRTPGTWVRLPGDYALRLVREAVNIGRASGTALPTRYVALREVFGEAPEPPERALVFDTVSPVEASLSPDWLEQSQDLVREREVAGWHVPISEALRARALEVARSTTSALLVPGNTPEQQALHLLGDAFREALTPTLRRALRRRLEETAFIFASTDRMTAARHAVAASAALEDATRPAERNPFARVLIEAGLARALRTEPVGSRPAAEVVLELIERALEQAREGNRGGVESRPSGLILPR
jgi:hypothetical protein